MSRFVPAAGSIHVFPPESGTDRTCFTGSTIYLLQDQHLSIILHKSWLSGETAFLRRRKVAADGVAFPGYELYNKNRRSQLG